MKLVIKNFGPIKHGEIDLTKKVHVFVGYNNTGKTYVSQLMYSILGHLFMEDFIEKTSLEDLGIVFTDKEFELTETIFKRFTNKYNEALVNELVPKTFNFSKNHHLLNKASFKIEGFNFSNIKNVAQEVISLADNRKENSKNAKSNAFIIQTISKSENSNTIKFKQKAIKDTELENWAVSPVSPKINKERLVIKLLINLLTGQASHSFYLPASRIFYPTFYQYIFNVEKEKRELASKNLQKFMEKFSVGNIPTPSDYFTLFQQENNALKSPYTEPTNNLINKIYDLKSDNEAYNYYSKQAESLEKLIGGKIKINNSNGISDKEFTLQVNEDNELDMYLASSSSNQLTTLYLYFRYWAEEQNNFLIIDEPEENLHPVNQIAVLNCLLEFAHANNNKILIVNHTPLFAESLNNYLMLGTLKREASEKEYGEIIKKLGILDIPLTKEEVGVYFFNGSEIREYEIGDYGTVFKDFDKEIYKIKSISEELSSSILSLKTVLA